MEIFPSNSKFDFMRWQRVALSIGAALLALALAALALRGLNLALDFTGGTLAEIEFKEPIELEGLRERLDAAGFEGAVVQTFGAANEIVVRLQPREGAGSVQQTAGAILEAANTAENPAKLLSSDFVGPQIGGELAYNGVLAMLFVLIGFMVYITIRFEWKFALAAILTTFFDVIITTGYFGLFQREFDLTVLAGLMSVMGYSINDTIVVFDRVRENFRNLQRVPAAEVLNRSVNQTLSRTVITSFVAFLTVVALYLYGGKSLAGMAESQMIGIVFGTLSSIFVACPLLLMLSVTKQDLMPKAKDLAELERRP